MSSLLKDAIVDAKALRESALKSAETSIIEKYSEEVKETLDQLLEQDELGAETPANSEDVAKNIPLAATDNLSEEEGDIPENMPTEGEEIPVTIDLDALQEAVKALESELEENEEIELSEEDLASILSEEDDEDDDDSFPDLTGDGKVTKADVLKGRGVELSEADAGNTAGSPEDPGSFAGEEADEEEEDDADQGAAATAASAAAANATDAAQRGAFEENIDMDSLVDAIMERLTVDMGAELSGWAGRSSDSMKFAMEKEFAHRRSTDVEEEMETLKKAQEEVVFENKQLSDHLTQHKQVIQELKENLQNVNLSNARLLYTNRVLRNTSLNERQKEKIAEAISNAGSVAEAKVICETLQNTVETKPKRANRSQSLSEVIGNKRSSVIRATRKESTTSDPMQDRMKRLAGIK